MGREGEKRFVGIASPYIVIVWIELNAHTTRVHAAKGAQTDICAMREQDI